LLNTPKVGSGSIYARLDKIVSTLDGVRAAHRKSTLSDTGGRKTMHQREASGKLLFFLAITAVLRIIFVLLLTSFACFDFSCVHNFSSHTFALPSLCKPCETRMFRCTVENGKRRTTYSPNVPHLYRSVHGAPCE